MPKKDTRAGHMDEQPPEPAGAAVTPEHMSRMKSLKTNMGDLDEILQRAASGDAEMEMPTPEEMMEIATQAEAESSDNIVLSACAMLNAFLAVDEGFIRTSLSRFSVATPSIQTASEEGRLPLRLAPLPDGRKVAGFLSFINALVLWLGAENFVLAVAGPKNAAGHQKIVGFEPALPLKGQNETQ